MKVLFIGGTGLISSAVSELALKTGIELYVLNRGTSRSLESRGAHSIICDISDEYAAEKALGDAEFDVVVNWIVYTPQEIERDFRLFFGRTKQYIFISSASVYSKPVTNYPITESSPIGNPYWDYAQRKAECEHLLMNLYELRGFPVTIVRPSHTYGAGKLIAPLTGFKNSWTYLERILSGKPVVVHGDGRSLWTVTHNTDFAKGFAGLLGNFSAIGHAFHLTSDEALSWDVIVETVYKILGVEPNIVHIASDFISSRCPEYYGPLHGDKAESMVFDNSKIKRFVPSFVCETPYHLGIRQVIDRLMSDAEGQTVDGEYNEKIDRLIEKYRGV
ncbi:MAG: SDR family oxidoreductase [Oscillospiraceae bacterium]|nr:SDR family oxidoreductase [Oscillospiraceae bacterium]